MSSLSLKRPPHTWLRRDESGNCLLWGCLSLFCFTVLIIIAATLIFRYGLNKFRDNFTTPIRAELPVVEISKGDLEKLMTRVDEFTKGLDDGERPASLILNETDINALIQHHPDYKHIKGNVFVTIEDDLVGGQVSFSLDGIPGLEGRYLNAAASFDVNFENGILSIFLKDATVKGEPLPAMLLEALRSENLAADAQDDEHLSETLDSLESFQVKNGKVTLIPKK